MKRELQPYIDNPALRGVETHCSGQLRECTYITGDGRRCVVGAMLKNPAEIVNRWGPSAPPKESWKSSGFFRPEYERVPLEVINLLQRFHDQDDHFDLVNGGLTSVGERQLCAWARHLREFDGINYVEVGVPEPSELLTQILIDAV